MKTSSLLLTVFAVGFFGCAHPPRAFPPEAPMWEDDDRHPFAGKPSKYFSPLGWDAADKTIFRPLSQFFAVDVGGEATNVNAFDEVPNSSWFQNRLGRHPMTVEQVARGACDTPPLDTSGPWTVVGAKPDGANPGFMIKAPDDRRYLLKFEGQLQPERAGTADVVGSLVYHAAGFRTPCNRIVFFHPSILEIASDATAEDSAGKETPLLERHMDAILEQGMKLPDGRVRASSSLLLDGKPLGPWCYHGTRPDDPNDVVPHEDRRELRASRVLAAWLNHHDAREQNTLAMWIEGDDGRGFIRHHMIDWGDCFGGLWDWVELSRRIGHQYYLDFAQVGRDFLTLGIVEHPWDHARFGPTGPVLGYYDLESFTADEWHVGYPNPAFSRMTERDAAWMTRIVARFSDPMIDAMIAEGRIRTDIVRTELTRILKGRRDKILARWLTRLSPLSHPRIEAAPTARLCLEDLAVTAGVTRAEKRHYAARWGRGVEPRSHESLPVRAERPGHVCVALPDLDGVRQEYFVVDVNAAPSEPPLRVHLYRMKSRRYLVAGLQRPASEADAMEGAARSPDR